MLDLARATPAEAAVGARALTRLDLLARVTRFKNLFFASSWSDYESARPGGFRLVPSEARRAELEPDYAEMQEFFTVPPPAVDVLWERLRVVEERINELGP